MTARFQVEQTFVIANRGFVIAGQVAAGRIRSGDHVVVPTGGSEQRYEIRGVEGGHRTNADGSVYGFTGLVLPMLPAAEVAALREALSSGQQLLVENSNLTPNER